MRAYLGLDVGSLTCDAVLVDERGERLAAAVVATSPRIEESIARAREEALARAGVVPEAVVAVIATGYGRKRVGERMAEVTEITSHARGISAVFPDTEVLIDIGGQDSKVIRLAPGGKVIDFAMNDKCAAGTGRFLEAMARVLELEIAEMVDLDRGARGVLTISSMCTVFAESEVISLIAEGAEVREIVHALDRAIASRIAAMARRVAPDVRRLRVAMSGGVARNSGVVRALEEALGVDLALPAEPDTIGALGAALIARERASRR